MRTLFFILLLLLAIGAAGQRSNRRLLIGARPPAPAAGGGGCAGATYNATADTEVGTWSKEPGAAATHFGLLDDGRGVASPADDEFIYKFDDSSADTDTLRFEGPDGSCDVTAVSITAMTQASGGAPGWACRVSPDNATWTAWVTNAMATGAAAEQVATWSVSWTTPADVYVQIKTTTGDFNVARIYSMQALVNLAP